jgi:2,3-bisphosphoglycerate-dependent phosphoglycerate mutase
MNTHNNIHNKVCEKGHCESCLMPFAKDTGTREDTRYCSLCFNHGKLCYEGNLKDFQEICRKNMIEQGGMNKIKAWFFSKMIAYAPRWKRHMGKFIVVRHHESDWNHKGVWTGVRDRHLTEYGFTKSEEMGLLIKEFKIDHAFASMQVRSIETLSSMLETMEQYHVPTEHSSSLNERDYGDYTGKDKWEMEKVLGEDGWNAVRREWNCPVPNGETLQMVYARAVPFFIETVLPHLKKGENVLMASHGNAIRALMKYIENIPDDEVKHIEMLFGQVVVYELDGKGHIISKDIRKTESLVHA